MVMTLAELPTAPQVGPKSDFLHPATPRPNLALTRAESPPRRLSADTWTGGFDG
jgi:hypothetical protein